MKKTLFILTAFFSLVSCNKVIEKKQDDLVTMAVTRDQWKVSRFVKGNDTLSADFALYLFKFQTNKTVDAIKNGRVTASGIWEADITTRSITSLFQNEPPPLALLNGTWIITNNSWTFVEARQSVNNEIYLLRLDKE